MVSEYHQHRSDVEQDHGVAEGAVALWRHPLLEQMNQRVFMQLINTMITSKYETL